MNKPETIRRQIVEKVSLAESLIPKKYYWISLLISGLPNRNGTVLKMKSGD